MSTKQDVFESIVDRLIESIETNQTGTWDQPWTSVLGGGGLGINASTKKAYRGFNQFVLMLTAASNGYAQNVWATYKQFQALGGQVRKGETGTLLVKWGKTYTCDTDNKKGRFPCPVEGHTSSVHMWASPFTVFNVAQQDGFEFELPDLGSEPERLAHVEEFVASTGAVIRHEPQNRAYYSPATDSITVPLREQFDTAQGYYGTVLHELTHWTGAEHRLARKKGRVFGDDAYAGEEFVAELGATFLAARFGVEAEPHIEHANYLGSWLKKVKADPRSLYRAAADAQAAVEFLMNGDFEVLGEEVAA